MRPSDMPSCSAWMIERAKLVVSGMSRRSAKFLRAWMRLSPMRISCSTIESSSSSGPLERSVMRARAPSKPRPASTETVRRSSTSGSWIEHVRAARAHHAADDEVGEQEGERAADEAEDQAVADGQEAGAGEDDARRRSSATMPPPLIARNVRRGEAVAEAGGDQPAADLVGVLRHRQRRDEVGQALDGRREEPVGDVLA